MGNTVVVTVDMWLGAGFLSGSPLLEATGLLEQYNGCSEAPPGYTTTEMTPPTGYSTLGGHVALGTVS